MKLLSIILTKQGKKFHAELDGQPDTKVEGKTREEAIGKLICDFQEKFKVKILLL